MEFHGFDSDDAAAKAQRILMILLDLCKKRNGLVCFIEFAVNPDFFAQTVQNICHITLLIKDGDAILYVGVDGFPLLENAKDEHGALIPHGIKEDQYIGVMSMDKEQWKSLVKAFNIENATIPPLNTFKGGAEVPGGSSVSSAGTI